ncbi:MAG: hypothetical protein ACR652_23545 [Methylocystis sp.]|uniref:hypothetical protein n=1 Tax=Methylocystis sp. TaxID=1911079 RepID=UPI003DA3EC12
MLAEALGITDGDFLGGLLIQLLQIGGDTVGTDERLNFLLSVIKDVKPRDQLETMLAAQMAVMHMATMTFAGRLSKVENLPQQESALNAFNKLARTFTIQMEALKRYRSGGEQKVTVQHVNVSEGGQAIVGNVAPPPKRRKTKPKRRAPALTHSQQAPMPLISEGQAEPVALRKAEKTNANGRKSSS